MSLTPLVDVLGQDPAVRRILELTATPGSEPFYDVTVAAGARPALLTAMVQTLAGPAGTGGQEGSPRPVVLVVTATTRACEDLAEALRSYLP